MFIVTNYFSGPGRVVGPVCMSVCPDNNVSVKWLLLTQIFGILVHLDTIQGMFEDQGHSSWSQEDCVAKVVGATSSEGISSYYISRIGMSLSMLYRSLPTSF